MPFIDVSGLTEDPDFATTFDVVRRTSSVDGTGVNTLSAVTTEAVVGVVYPASTTELIRLPEAERTGGTVMVISMFPLTTGDSSLTADVVVWPSLTGRQYTVVSVDDYSQFGAGFFCATCRVKDVQ